MIEISKRIKMHIMVIIRIIILKKSTLYNQLIIGTLWFNNVGVPIK